MKKKAILTSTLKLISERGVHNTPMSKIAADANVAVGTIYHHFDSKEEILNELYLDIKKEFGACIGSALAETRSAEEVFSEVFQAIYFYYTENPLKYSFTEQVAFTPIITEKVKNEARQHYKSMYLFFEKNIKEGILRDIPLDLMAELCYGNIKTVIQMKLSNHQSVTDSILQ